MFDANEVQTEDAAVISNEVLEAKVVFAGLALAIDKEIEGLLCARDLAVNLESGIDTQVGIRKTSVALREALYTAKGSIHGAYKEVMVVRETLLDGLGSVQATKSEEALKKVIADAQAKLAAL